MRLSILFISRWSLVLCCAAPPYMLLCHHAPPSWPPPVTQDGRTALMLAAAEGHLACVSRLLAKEANYEATDNVR